MSGACGQGASRRVRGAFIGDQKGAIAPLFAMMLVTVVGMAGAGIDFARAMRVESRISAAADAATLAATRAVADMVAKDPGRPAAELSAAAEVVGRASFTNNMAQHNGVSVGSFALEVKRANGAWSAKSRYQANVETTLAAVVGYDSISVVGEAEATISPGFPVLDIAMCVDSTGSMTPTLEAVKSNALGLFDLLNNELTSKNIPPFPLVRVRMIYFKDFGDSTPGLWDPDPIRASEFFALPAQASDFSAFVAPQTAFGGFDTPESDIECLNEAMSSKWMKVGDSPAGFSATVTDVFPLIVVWTDSPAHPIPYPNSLANPDYPAASKMPRDFDGLRAKWDDPTVIDQANKQIVFFGDPDLTSPDQGSYESGWKTVKAWPKFTVGGTLTEANASMIEFLAKGVALNAKGLRLSQ